MKAGDELLGRYRLVERLPSPAGQLRWRVQDLVGEQPAELVAPDARVALRPGAAEYHQRAQQRPAASPVAVLPAGPAAVDRGRPVAARSPVRGPVQPDLRLDADQVLAWAAWLGPAALALEPALGGDLSPADLVVDERGTVRLAPAGLVPPATRLLPARHLAPELRAGGPLQPGSGLYGLGVLLFRALTGAWPVDASSDAALATGAAPRRASELRPTLDPVVDQLLADLLDPDPARRVAATLALPSAAPVQAPVMQPAATTSSGGSPAVRTTRESQPAPARRESLPWAVVARTQGLTDAGRRRLAALLDLDQDALERLVATGLPLPLEPAADEDTATERARIYTQQGLPAQAWPADSTGTGALLTGLGAASTLLAAILVGLLGLGLGASALPLALALLVTAAGLGLLSARGARRAQAPRQLRRAEGKLRQLVAPMPEDRLEALGRVTRLARAQVLAAELPPPVRLDLEAALDQVEEERALLAPRWEQVELRPALELDLGELEALVDELRDAARAARRAAESPTSREPGRTPRQERTASIRRRAEAARATARELGRD